MLDLCILVNFFRNLGGTGELLYVLFVTFPGFLVVLVNYFWFVCTGSGI